MILLRPFERTGCEPFIVELQEVFMVSYMQDLQHHKTEKEERDKYPSSYFFHLIHSPSPLRGEGWGEGDYAISSLPIIPPEEGKVHKVSFK